MAQPLTHRCYKCKELFTEENCTPCVLKRGSGLCNSCRRKYRRGPEVKQREAAQYAEYYKNNTEKMKLKSQRYRENNLEKVALSLKIYRINNRELLSERDKAASRGFKGRHNTLRHALKRERISETDLLWNFNFYCALIQDLECHYCLGPLNATGGALDRINNEMGHTCNNVVPCCRRCNRMKGNDISYSEMFLLAPALRQIQKQKVCER